MALGRLWAGKVYGTNTGNLFIELNGDDSALQGTLRVNEPGVGIAVYSIEAVFDGVNLSLKGKPEVAPEGVALGQLAAHAALTARGELDGEWTSDVGTAGTFVLFPHDRRKLEEAGEPRAADQLHTARYHFGAIEVDRNAIIRIAEDIQREFKNGEVFVTVVADTEQTLHLQYFKAQESTSGRASIIRLFAQESEGTGVNRIAQVEFGPQINLAMTQGGDEAWVLGMLEKLKRGARPLERTYSTNIKRFGFGVNQLLIVGAVVYLPSLSTLRDRSILMAGILTIVFSVNWLHSRYLPFAAIYLGSRPEGLFARIAPNALSWFIAATAGLVATLLAAYLQGLIWPPQHLLP